MESRIFILDRDVKSLILKKVGQVEKRIKEHKRAGNRFKQYDLFLGYPIVILSTFITSSIITTLSQSESMGKGLSIVVCILSSISLFLIATRNYMQFGKLYNKHEMTARLYMNLDQKIKTRLLKTLNIAELRNIYESILEQLSTIELYAEPLPLDLEDLADEAVLEP